MNKNRTIYHQPNRTNWARTHSSTQLTVNRDEVKKSYGWRPKGKYLVAVSFSQIDLLRSQDATEIATIASVDDASILSCQ